jgi:peptidoglycan/LPS O-acetylase OafA/YrhL
MSIETKDLEPILDRVHEWTRSADTKVDILTAIEAAVVALLISPLVTWVQDPKAENWQKLMFVLGFLLLVAALINSLQALFPRIDRSGGALS